MPQARTRRHPWSRYSVWLVPLAAALLAGYLIYGRVREMGPKITLHFADASGVNPGQTPVTYRGVDIGQVASVKLSEDQRSAILEVQLRTHAESVARAGSVFWIVRPEVGLGNLTGLGTIVSGPYIEVMPGQGKPATEFVGAEQSPKLLDPEGLHVVLMSPRGGSLHAGVPIYYRGIPVGNVSEMRLGTNAALVEVHGVIRKRYADLVRIGSKFWNVTGMDVRVGLFSGAEVNLESIKYLVVGGIAFATPEDPTGFRAPQGAVFELHEEVEEEWLEWSPPITLPPAMAPSTPSRMESANEPSLAPSVSP